MKRPEYVAIVTGRLFPRPAGGPGTYARGAGAAGAGLLSPGLYPGLLPGPEGPGHVRRAPGGERAPELYAQARATYENGENRKEPVRMYAMIRPDQPAQVAVEDREGHVARVEGRCPSRPGTCPSPGRRWRASSPAPAAPLRLRDDRRPGGGGPVPPPVRPERPAPPGPGRPQPAAGGPAGAADPALPHRSAV